MKKSLNIKMNINQIVEKILHSKNYKNYQKSFIKKIVLKNINKQDVLKSSKLTLHEISGMFGSLQRKQDVDKIWKFAIKDIGKHKKILDLACGHDYEVFRNIKNINYTGVDVIKDENIIQDDILNPVKSWDNEDYDVVLMLNVIPVIERLEKDSGVRLINKWKEKSKYVVLSFPLYSLSSKKNIGSFWKEYIKNILKKEYDVVGDSIVVIIKGKT